MKVQSCFHYRALRDVLLRYERSFACKHHKAPYSGAAKILRRPISKPREQLRCAGLLQCYWKGITTGRPSASAEAMGETHGEAPLPCTSHPIRLPFSVPPGWGTASRLRGRATSSQRVMRAAATPASKAGGAIPDPPSLTGRLAARLPPARERARRARSVIGDTGLGVFGHG